MKLKNFYVYIYLDPRKPGSYDYGKLHFDYEPIYIGMGRGNRIEAHIKTCYTPNKKIHNTHFIGKLKHIIKDHKNPIYYKLYTNLSEKSAKRREIFLIKLIGRHDLGLGFLTNLTDGGEGTSGYKRTEEQRQHISNIKKGKPNYNKRGIKHSEETRKKISETRLKKHFSCSEDFKKKRSERLLGKTYEELYGKEKAKEIKLKQREKQIGHKSSTKGKTYVEIYGQEKTDQINKKRNESRISYKHSNETKEKIRKKRYHAVLQYTLSGIFIAQYKSIYDAKMMSGAKNISSVCLAEGGTSGGYQWRYKNSDKINYKIKPITVLKKPQTEEAKKRIKEARSKQNMSHLKKAICVFSFDGYFIKKFDSITEAKKWIGNNSVYYHLTLNKPSGKYIWVYEKDIYCGY